MGGGKLSTSGVGASMAAKEAVKVGFDFLKANATRISAGTKIGDHDFHLHLIELHTTLACPSR